MQLDAVNLFDGFIDTQQRIICLHVRTVGVCGYVSERTHAQILTWKTSIHLSKFYNAFTSQSHNQLKTKLNC